MGNQKHKYIINFKDVKAHYNMFEIISNVMEFPDCFGNNWGAFQNCMTDIICINLENDIINLNALYSEIKEDKEKLICLYYIE